MNILLRIRIGMTSFSFPKRTADKLKLCSVIGEVGLLHRRLRDRIDRNRG